MCVCDNRNSNTTALTCTFPELVHLDWDHETMLYQTYSSHRNVKSKVTWSSNTTSGPNMGVPNCLVAFSPCDCWRNLLIVLSELTTFLPIPPAPWIRTCRQLLSDAELGHCWDIRIIWFHAVPLLLLFPAGRTAAFQLKLAKVADLFGTCD